MSVEYHVETVVHSEIKCDVCGKEVYDEENLGNLNRQTYYQGHCFVVSIVPTTSKRMQHICRDCQDEIIKSACNGLL